MTTDFVITLKTSNGLIDVVRTVKPVSMLNKRTLELFEIERCFFVEQGINWGIVTDSKLPETVIKNVEWMAGSRYLETRPDVDKEFVDLISRPLFEQISKDGGKTGISKICLLCDEELQLKPGTGMFVLQYMLANKKWATDMNVLIQSSRPLQVVNLENQSINKKFG